DSAELAAAGLGGICTSGKAFKLDNTFGGATTAYIPVSGVTGNTNPHTMSVYMRSTSSARMVLSSSGGTNWGTSAVYARRSATVTPANSSQQLVIEAAPGVIVWFVLNQLEEATFSSSPIVTEGGTGTVRAADIISMIEPGGLSGGFELRCDVDLERLSDPVDRCIAALGEGAIDNAHLLFVGPDNRLIYEMRQGGVLRLTLATDPIVSTGVKAVRLKSKDGDYALETAGLAAASDNGTYARPNITTGLWGSRFDGSKYLNLYMKKAFVAAA
ncbi:MAG: hypothetical protein KKA81_17030, partial [Bacteroidetes bacterium]|nr:hypothetical protein [Bacteroidota bacterium]